MLSRIFGANWKTTLSGGLRSVFSAIVTGSLAFPSDWHDPKQIALFACVVAATFFGIQFAVQTKSKEVTGGSVAQDENNAVAKPQPAIAPPPQAAVPQQTAEDPFVSKPVDRSKTIF